MKYSIIMSHLIWIRRVLLLVFVTSLSQADMSYLYLKGVHNLIKKEHQPAVSPVAAYTTSIKLLPSRRFLGNYGPKKAGYSCLEGTDIGKILEKNNDCPQDSISELIQRFFPSHDGVNFVANQIPVDFVSNLSFETIGRLLSKITEFKAKDLDDKYIANELTEEFTNILEAGCAPAQFLNKQETRKKIDQYEDCKNLGLGGSYLGKDIELIKRAEEIIQHHQPKKVGGNFGSLASLIVSALKEQRFNNNEKESVRKDQNNLVEHTLLAYFLKKANKKEDFLELFSGMKNLLEKPEILTNKKEIDDFIKLEFLPQEYDPTVIQSNKTLAISNFIKDPELMIFSFMQDSQTSNLLPSSISYAYAKHSALGKETMYPDCGETALRNFFNFITYDHKTGTFNVNNLKNLKDYNVDQNIISFYEKYNTQSKANTQEARNEWGNKITSNHEGVIYNKETKCDIQAAAGIDNMLTLISQLITPKVDGKKLFEQNLSRSAKIDALCKAVSRENFQLSLNEKQKNEIDSKNTNVSVQFWINNKLGFQWDFLNNHFSIKDLTQQQNSLKSIIADQFINQMNHFQPNTNSELLLQWLSSKDFFEKLNKEKLSDKISLKARENMIYALLSANSNEQNLMALREVQFLRSPQREALTEKLIDRLPFDDLYTQEKSFRTLLENNYPMESFIKIFSKNELRKRSAIFGVANFGNNLQLKELILNSFPVSLWHPLNEVHIVGSYLWYQRNPIEVSASKQNFFQVVESMKSKLAPELFLDLMTKPNTDNNTPLHSAAPHLVKPLLKLLEQEQGGKVKIQEIIKFQNGVNGNTLAHLAAKEGNLELLNAIEETNPEIWSVKNGYGYTPFHLMTPHKDAFKFFSEFKKVHQGVDIQEILRTQDKDGNILAHLAAKQGNLELLNAIRETSPEIWSVKNKNGHAPLDLLLSSLASKTLSGPDIKRVEDIANQVPFEIWGESIGENGTPLYLAAKDPKNEVIMMKIVTNVLEKARNIEINKVREILLKRDKHGNTLAHLVTSKGFINQLKLIRELVPEILEAKNSSGDTVGHLAITMSEWDIVKYFIENASADTLAIGNKSEINLAHLLIKKSQSELTMRLAQVAPNAFLVPNVDSETAIYLAILGNKTALVTELIKGLLKKSKSEASEKANEILNIKVFKNIPLRDFAADPKYNYINEIFHP